MQKIDVKTKQSSKDIQFDCTVHQRLPKGEPKRDELSEPENAYHVSELPLYVFNKPQRRPLAVMITKPYPEFKMYSRHWRCYRGLVAVCFTYYRRLT